MHIILGATGHIGSTVTNALLDRGEVVMVVSRDAQKAARFQSRGANVAVVDVHDTCALRDAGAYAQSALFSASMIRT